MAQIIAYVNYVIFFQDPTEYATAVAIAGSPILEMCPADAAALFSIPYNPLPSGDVSLIPKGMYSVPPYSDLEGPGDEIGFPNPSGILMDPTVGSVLVPGQAGSPASIFPAGPDALCVWSATIIQSNAAGSAAAPSVYAIAQRRYLTGFEHGADLNGFSGNAVADYSIDASRVLGGRGLRAGGPNSRSLTATIGSQLRGALVAQTNWDRFYFRARILPPNVNSNIAMWRATCSAGASMGAQINYESTGILALYNINNASTYFAKGTILSPVIGEWYKIDIFTRVGTHPASTGGVQVYVNGVFALGFTDSTGEGISTGVNLISIVLGQGANNTNLGEIDLDDWVGSDLPSNVSTTTLNFLDTDYPLDWILGSHIIKPFALSASLTNWTPNNYGNLDNDQNFSREATFTGVTTTSITNTATMQGLTDAPPNTVPFPTYASVAGPAAAVISLYSRNAGATDGTLGYVKTTTTTTTTVNQTAANAANFMGYIPSGMIFPDETTPWSVVHTKSADANLDTTTCLVSEIEYLGVFAPEDAPGMTIPNPRTLNHNWNYANTEYGFWSALPAEPVFAYGATYVGNGTVQDITLPGPAHFIVVRNPTNSVGFWWFGTSLGPTTVANNDVMPFMRCLFDPVSATYKMRIWSSDTRINANGITYQLVAFCDPGCRFNVTSVFAHPTSASTPQVNAIPVPSFIPDAAFFQNNCVQSGGAVSQAIQYKGPGITANIITRLDGGGNQTNGANFTTSDVINTFADLHGMSNINNRVYSAWRTADSGASGCSNVMVQIMTYTGNGAGARTITLTPTSGRVPLWVMLQASGGAGRFRDPAHTLSSSGILAGFSSDNNGITAVGVDSITVATGFNVNLTVYTVFAICGATSGMSNGTYYPSYCVPPSYAPGPTAPSADILVSGSGGLVLGGDPGIALLLSVSGIYTLTDNLRHDTLIDRRVSTTTTTNVQIPNIVFKTGYIGG